MLVKLTTNQLIGARAYDRGDVVEVSEPKACALLKAKAAVPANAPNPPAADAPADAPADDDVKEAKVKSRGKKPREDASAAPHAETADD